ncbi:troponin I-like isoform X2 [Tubulanus polymorphus]|uniref:troponin I-like isoform X2 n=1 Tax=Tubulanus polymorphus TaxID=672921 RepID=UPI003DA39007
MSDTEEPQQQPQQRRRRGDDKKGKKKGMGGLSAEKKKLLKKIIMEKAAEEMRMEAKKKAEARQHYIDKAISPLNLEGLDQGSLERKVKELYQQLKSLEDEKYDWEIRIRRQDIEINELNGKVNDVKGKFIKPVLKKVSKTESKLAKFDKKKEDDFGNFRQSLKSTGQSKYQLDEKEEAPKKPDWRGTLKSSGEEGEEEGEGGAPPAEEVEED